MAKFMPMGRTSRTQTALATPATARYLPRLTAALLHPSWGSPPLSSLLFLGWNREVLLGRLSTHNLCQAPEWPWPVLPQVPRYVLTAPVWLGEALDSPCPPTGPLLSLHGDSVQGAMALNSKRLPAASAFAPTPGLSPAQTASWRNKCSWMARASPTPETPARSAGVRKAKPVASLGPAPGPPVPTRCLGPAARITAVVRWTGGGRGDSLLAPSMDV